MPATAEHSRSRPTKARFRSESWRTSRPTRLVAYAKRRVAKLSSKWFQRVPLMFLPLPLGEGRSEGPAQKSQKEYCSPVALNPHPLPDGKGIKSLAVAALIPERND